MFFIHWNIAPKFLSVRLRDADMETKQTAVYYGAVVLIDLPCSLVSPKLNLNYTRYLFFVCFVTFLILMNWSSLRKHKWTHWCIFKRKWKLSSSLQTIFRDSCLCEKGRTGVTRQLQRQADTYVRGLLQRHEAAGRQFTVRILGFITWPNRQWNGNILVKRSDRV